MYLNKVVKNDFFILLLFVILYYSLFRSVGTFTEGFNITEDHALITTHQSLETNSFSTVLSEMMRTEMEGIQRFRPVWVFYLLFTIKIFGVDLLSINIFVALLCVITSFFLYKFASNIGFNKVQSFLFSSLTIIGPATVMYIRPPDAEIVGMLMMSITLFFLSKSIYAVNHKLLFKFCFIFTLTLLILCKESFMITIPAILLLYVIIYRSKNKTGLFKAIKSNKVILIISFLILLFLLLYLISSVGINHKKGYSGVDVNLFSMKVIFDFIITILKTSMFYLILLGFVILIIYKFKDFKWNFKIYRRKIISLLLVMIFFLLIVIPQLIIYYKTGFFVGRYYLPYLMGFAFFTIFLLKMIFDVKLLPNYAKYFYISILFLFLIYQIKAEVIPALVYHSDVCKESTQMIESIIDSSENKLLIVMDPVQNYYHVYSLKIILDYLNGEKDYKYDFLKTDYPSKMYADTSFSNKILIESEKKLGANIIDSSKNNSDINDILIFWSLDKKFVEKNRLWFKENNFRKKNMGNYILYSRK